MDKTLVLTSPHMHGPVVRDCQYLLQVNVFRNFNPGKRDGIYGEKTGSAVRRAKYELGYAMPNVNRRFGHDLYAYLHGDKKISPFMRVRRKRRLAQQQHASSVKGKALELALAEARKGVK